MKRVKASVLAVILAVLTVVGGMLGLANVTVKAADPLKVSVDTVDAAWGQKEVEVAVNVENPSQLLLGGLQLAVTFDTTALEATSAVAGDFTLADPVVNTERLAEGFIGYADASAGGKTTQGKAIVIKFNVLDGAKVGANPVNVQILSAALADNNATAITDAQAVNGGITLPEKPAPEAVKLSVATVNAIPGQKNVEVAVNVENPGDLAGLQFGITFDTTALKATSAVAGDFKLSSGVGDEKPEVNTEKIEEGFIGYADASANGTSNSGTVMIITFDVLDGAKLGANAITIGDSVAAKGTDASELPVQVTNGAINVVDCTHAKVTDADYKTVKEPTYKEEGLAEATCPDCGTVLTRPIAKLEGCTHANVKDSDYKVTKPATYQEEGTEEAECPDCGTILTRSIPKLVCTHANVKDSDYVVTKEPTLGEEGVKEATCPDCGEKLTISIPKLERPAGSEENIIVDVKTEVSITVDVPKGVADNNLTKEEQDAILNDGVDTTVNVDVTDVNEADVPAADKAAIENQLPTNITVAAFIDIRVTLQVGTSVARTITETASQIAFTVEIPADLLNVPAGYVRTYNIVRVHAGVAEILNSTRSGNTLSFASDKFSTYAIVYEDKAETTNPSTPDNNTTNPSTPDDTTQQPSAPQTGDTLPVALFALMLAGIIGIVVSSKKRA